MSKILNINFISDLDDTASVEHEGHYQNPYSIFFFPVNDNQRLDCQIYEVIVCHARALDPM